MKLKLTIDGKPYEVEVEVVAEDRRPTFTNTASATPLLGSAPRASASGGAASLDPEQGINSPLTGVVNAIEAKVGDEVAPDQPILVLEAMKMLTTITAPAPAKIKAFHVAVGDAVKQGQALVEFE